MNRQRKRKRKRKSDKFWGKINRHYDLVVSKQSPNISRQQFIQDTKNMLEDHTMPEVLSILETGIIPGDDAINKMANILAENENNPNFKVSTNMFSEDGEEKEYTAKEFGKKLDEIIDDKCEK